MDNIEVLNLLKVKLGIGWTEEDSLLNELIEESKDYLINIVVGGNENIDFSLPFNKSVLLERCRYVYNNASEYFEENFRSQLIQFKIRNVANGNTE